MNIYITKVNGMSMWNSLQYRQWMTVEIAHQMGCREMGIFCYNGSAETDDSLRCRLDGIVAGLRWGEDVVICQFPTGNGLRFERGLVNRLKVYQVRIIIFIYDSENLVRESNQAEMAEIIELYNQAEVLIVPSVLMQQFLLDIGIRKDMKFVIQEMWDYKLEMNYIHSPEFYREIHYIGSGFAGMVDWQYAVPLKVYTLLEGQRKNADYFGELSPGEQVSMLSRGGFGLVWYQDTNAKRGLEYGNSFELAKYLAAGIPVIAPVGISNQTLIEKNHLGMVVDSIEEAVAAVEAVTEGEYHGYIRSIRRFVPTLRGGYYTKRCLVDAVHTLCTKDVGRFTTPVKVYDPGEHEFTYIVLKESYGESFSLSWSYRGEADGFLIYDTFGKLIYETRNIHQHYYKIRRYRKESGFIVKAYIDTMRGKMSIEESEPIYLYPGKYEYPEVSLVIPAYNAEDYIARGIDTALAQSFFNVEIIIVDDGSTDHTLDIINWYAEKYPNVRVIHQKNEGPAAARNKGIKMAKGEYIGFLDSDDMLCPDMVSRLYHSAKLNDCDIAITSVYKIEDDGYKVIMAYQLEENVAISVEDFFRIYFHTDIFMVAVWNKLYRAALVKEHLFPKLILGEDGAWTPYILSHAENICYLNDLSYEYDRVVCKSTLMRQWGENQTKEGRFLIHKEMVNFYLKNGNPKRIGLLKVMAKWSLIGWNNIYVYDQYEELWKQIEEIF